MKSQWSAIEMCLLTDINTACHGLLYAKAAQWINSLSPCLFIWRLSNITTRKRSQPNPSRKEPFLSVTWWGCRHRNPVSSIILSRICLFQDILTVRHNSPIRKPFLPKSDDQEVRTSLSIFKLVGFILVLEWCCYAAFLLVFLFSQ